MATLRELSIAEIAVIKARILRGDKYADIASDFRLNQGRRGDRGWGRGLAPRPDALLGAHDAVGPAIGLTGDDRHLGHGGLREGEQQLGAVLDEAAVLLRRSRQEARHVDEGDDGDLETVA